MPPCPAPDTSWLYLIRHGSTPNNEAHPPLIQGRRSDQPLSPKGQCQAEATARFLARQPIAVIYSSPLLRARQTAEPIACAHDLSVELVNELIEADVGLWEGRTWEEIGTNDPEGLRRFNLDAAKYPYLGGESYSAVLKRVRPVLERLMAANLGRVFAVVAHNAVNRAYLTELLNIPLARYRSVPQDNCGVNLIRYRAGQAQAITINSIDHLDDCG